MAQRAHIVNVSNRCYLPLLNATIDTIITFSLVLWLTGELRWFCVLSHSGLQFLFRAKDRFNHLWK